MNRREHLPPAPLSDVEEASLGARLGTALHEPAPAPDLDRLLTVAVARGCRIRRQRRLLVAGSAVAASVAVAAAVMSLPDGTSRAVDVEPAVQPTLVGTTVAPAPTTSPSTPPSSTPSASTPPAVVTAPPSQDAGSSRPPVASPSLSLAPAAPATQAPSRTPSSPSSPTGFPVRVEKAGWTCTDPQDDKLLCTSGSKQVQVTVRPKSQYAAYTSDPDKQAPGQYVSRIHRDVFAVVTEPYGDAALCQEIGDALVWAY